MLNPKAVTDYFLIEPSRSFSRGDIRLNDKKWPHGYWELESSRFVQSEDLIKHLEWLINQVESVKPKFAYLMKNEDIEAIISCFWIMSSGHGAILLSNSLLRRIADLNIDLELDIHGSE